MFRFDVQKGLIGEADLVQMEGRYSKQAMLRLQEKSTTKATYSSHTQAQQREVLQVKAKASIKRGLNSNWFWLLLLVPLAVAYVYLKKR